MEVADVSIDEFWAVELGVSVEQLTQPGVRLISEARGRFEDYDGVLLFSRGDTVIVSAPPGVAAAIQGSIDRLSPSAVHDVALLREILGTVPIRVIGPVFQGFVTPAHFRGTSPSKRVTTSDLQTVQSELGAACDEAEWEASGLVGVGQPIATLQLDGIVVAAAGLRERAEGVVDPCVLAHPSHRGRGLAKELVAHITAAALERGDLVVYQTLLANEPAVAIALSLGFEHYATGVAMRLS